MSVLKRGLAVLTVAAFTTAVLASDAGHQAAAESGPNTYPAHADAGVAPSSNTTGQAEVYGHRVNVAGLASPPAKKQKAQPAAASKTAPAQPSSGGGGGGCSGMEAESGSEGYGAYNSSGPGYIGCYQISSDHYNGGSCSGLGQDPAGQDACAQRICATEGAGAWTNGAGQNPCKD